MNSQKISNRRLTRVPLLLVIGLALVGLLNACNATGTPTPTVPPPTATSVPIITPTPPAGWSIHTQSGFQIALPNTWEEIPLDDTALKNAIDAASNNNPHLADTLRGILTSGQNKNLIFYAADQANTNVITNVSVARAPLPAGTSVDQAAHDYANALPQVLKGAKLIAIDSPLEVNGQQAAEVDYDLPLVNNAGQVVTVRGIQYLVAGNTGTVYVVTVTGDAAEADKFMPLGRQIAQSFVVTTP